MSDTALIPAALYGLRTWRVATDGRGELLTATCEPTWWPDGGAWLQAACGGSRDHDAPGPDCNCGIHAWHPSRTTARRVLASRFEVPGIVEAAGAAQVHDEGFRAQRARPYVLVVAPGRNAKLVARLAERYRAEMLEVTGPDALIALCRERGLGLDEATVAELLGADTVLERREARRRRRRTDVLRIATALAVAGALIGLGGALASGPPSPHGVYGRTGWVVRPHERKCPPPPSKPTGPHAPPAAARANC
ncbi:MAG: hypothetical protein JWQ20_389 [Conexibacter sp.]|nr:hypothetical protein [Conexibacter sp.]